MGRFGRVNLLIGTGHFLSHFYILTLPPMFIAWQHAFGASYAELGLTVALMSGITAVLQTPVGFLVDRHGARPFLVGGTLLMTLAMAAMGFATAFWQVLALAFLSGVGNSVIHPADYAILSGSIERSRMGRAFALHTFSGNLGFAAGPPVTAALMLAVGWRSTLLVEGLLGIPLVLTILWQSRILADQAKPAPAAHAVPHVSGRQLLLTPTMLLFFGFYMLTAMAGAGLQSWLITVLHTVHHTSLEAGSSVLTGYMVGATSGTLVGGWVADRTDRLLGFVILLTIGSSSLLLAVNALALPDAAMIGVMVVSGLLLGASRTPRDVMVKDAAPAGQVGKVFGFVSAGLPLGTAITPVPFGFLIDRGRPELVLVLVAALLIASLFCAGSARSVRAAALPAPAE
ncbi:MAG: MFS transporter [Alphaproteobacteria bacterium]|nr:MFS transporter [Alphaproteobacteria bacterium]